MSSLSIAGFAVTPAVAVTLACTIVACGAVAAVVRSSGVQMLRKILGSCCKRTFHRQLSHPEGFLASTIFSFMQNINVRPRQMALKSANLSEKDTSIVELGCANGLMLDELDRALNEIHGSEISYRVFGVDPAKSSVDAARARMVGRASVSVLDGGVGEDAPQQLPLADESADLVIHTNCVYFWKNLDLGMQDVFRVLRKGGRHVFEMAQPEHLASLHKDSPDLFRNTDQEQVLEAMRAAGFSRITLRKSTIKNGESVLSPEQPASKGLRKQGNGNMDRWRGKGRKRASSRGGELSTGDHEASSASDIPKIADGEQTLDEAVLGEQQLYVFIGHKPRTG